MNICLKSRDIYGQGKVAVVVVDAVAVVAAAAAAALPLLPAALQRPRASSGGTRPSWRAAAAASS